MGQCHLYNGLLGEVEFLLVFSIQQNLANVDRIVEYSFNRQVTICVYFVAKSNTASFNKT